METIYLSFQICRSYFPVTSNLQSSLLCAAGGDQKVFKGYFYPFVPPILSLFVTFFHHQHNFTRTLSGLHQILCLFRLCNWIYFINCYETIRFCPMQIPFHLTNNNLSALLIELMHLVIAPAILSLKGFLHIVLNLHSALALLILLPLPNAQLPLKSQLQRVAQL